MASIRELNRSFVLSAIIAMIAAMLCVCGCSTESRHLADRFSEEDLREDFEQLRRLILDGHPKTFTDLGNLHRVFDRQYGLLQDSLTILEFYRIIAPAVSSVRCGHTRLSLPESISEELRDTGGYLPLDIRIIKDSLYVTESYSYGQPIERGSCILSINGTDASDIIDGLKSCLPADGRNETYKYFNLNQDFRSNYMTFMGSSAEFNVTYLDSHSVDVKTLSVAAMSLKEIRDLKRMRRLGNPSELLVETSISNDNCYALLRVRFFHFYDGIGEFTETIDNFFSELSSRSVGALVLDLRGNDGGDPYSSAYLLGYLIGHPYRYFSSQSTFMHGDLKEIQDAPEHPFSGQSCVLIDGGCYSTTGHFCSLLKYHADAVFLGEETGGSFACNGGYEEHVLKNTGICLLLPYTTFITDVEGLPRDSGILPDITVEPSIQDLLDGTDPVLDSAASLICARRSDATE
jgi:hypothetical protein